MSTMSMDEWKRWATSDAEHRGLHALKPLLEGLAAATARLRGVEWQPAADMPVQTGGSAAGDRGDK